MGANPWMSFPFKFRQMQVKGASRKDIHLASGVWVVLPMYSVLYVCMYIGFVSWNSWKFPQWSFIPVKSDDRILLCSIIKILIPQNGKDTFYESLTFGLFAHFIAVYKKRYIHIPSLNYLSFVSHSSIQFICSGSGQVLLCPQ